MRICAGAAIPIIAGFASRQAHAVINTSIVFQVSMDGVNWSSSLEPFSGQPTTTVLVRAIVSYTGTASPLGLSSFVFQPTISNARPGDSVLPFVNGGAGSNTSTPLGVISGSQLTDTTSFGRVMPWGAVPMAPGNAIRGFFHTNPNGDGVNYLRIAGSQATAWIGGAGNTSGGSGVAFAQFSDVGRTTAEPPFNPSLQNIYVFKFGLSIATGGGQLVEMDIDAPLGGFGQRNSTTGDREVYWFANMNEGVGSIRGTASVSGARIFVLVPTPTSLTFLGAGVFILRHRRRS